MLRAEGRVNTEGMAGGEAKAVCCAKTAGREVLGARNEAQCEEATRCEDVKSGKTRGAEDDGEELMPGSAMSSCEGRCHANLTTPCDHTRRGPHSVHTRDGFNAGTAALLQRAHLRRRQSTTNDESHLFKSNTRCLP